jgi:hypothetical protein
VRSQEGRRRPSREGAGKTGCALHPRSHVQRVAKKTHMSIQVQRKHSGLPCAMVLTACFVLSPARPCLFVTVAPQKRELLKNLMPGIGASGPHDLTVRLTRHSSKAHPRPPLPAPTSVTMANVPSSRDGMTRNKQLIWVWSQGLFLKIRSRWGGFAEG